MGVEPTYQPWEGRVIPIYDSRNTYKIQRFLKVGQVGFLSERFFLNLSPSRLSRRRRHPWRLSSLPLDTPSVQIPRTKQSRAGGILRPLYPFVCIQLYIYIYIVKIGFIQGLSFGTDLMKLALLLYIYDLKNHS